jgi:hypothetical protein
VKIDGLKETLWIGLKDIDSTTISGLLKPYFYCFSTFSIVLSYYYQDSSKGVLIAALISIPLAFVIFGITDKTGKLLSRIFYAGRKPTWTIQEKFQSDLDQVMFFKRQRQFPQALKKVNEILNQEPEFAEALFLKAQILWEGYETANGARRYLNKAKDTVSPEGYLYRWICSYYNGINEKVKSINKLDLITTLAEKKHD